RTETGMEALAALTDGPALRAALWPLVEEYRGFVAEQKAKALGGDPEGRRAKTRDELLADAEMACARITDGIERLASDAIARQAFCWMNAAMASAARQRSPDRYAAGAVPAWRLFQLAFVLLNIEGVASDDPAERDIVELVFFPTGGGKTEAYLGVIGFTLLLRRLHGQSRDDGGLGVAVLLRYTLRLLTLDQLERAATLICALELQRRAAPKRLGEVRFAIGLWVGRSATANTMSQVKKALTEHSAGRGQSPLPLSACPWCRTAFKKNSLTLQPDAKKPTRVDVCCPGTRCDFNERGGGVPVLFVDEQIYRELPCFVLATVDKFAMLPWRGETGALFGRVHSHQPVRSVGAFYGPMDAAAPKPGHRLLPEGLGPPELFVQDEVHLISGPLGTMTGLYETAIDALSRWQSVGGAARQPKIIASTATVRRARAQMAALFGRGETKVFPPPGVDDGETFFGERDVGSPDRRYVGVAAAGRAFKAVQLRVYVALLAAAQKLAAEHGTAAVDGWMTVLGYFNSLRELGGMRRLAEDEVRSRARKASERRPLDKHAGPHRWLAKRDVASDPVELTSRESTAGIAAAKDRLKVAHGEPKSVDVALATNMISVGLDIDRLGLMVVSGQPKTTAEYIQASSRVGRQARRAPGLVVTCLNLHRSRDRSHYEDFGAYHSAFYRRVEVNSLTPFSKPALDRGLAGLLVTLVRLADPSLTPPQGVERLATDRRAAEAAITTIVDRAARVVAAVEHDAAPAQATVDDLRQRLMRLVDDWARLMEEARRDEAGKRCYSGLDRGRHGKPLLLPKLSADSMDSLTDAERRFTAPTSMRDVEPSVHLWVNRVTK
ncbi:MAG: helicase, partial [Myxococcales bacterium]|nr:helicase [Myxococcales bacterium]